MFCVGQRKRALPLLVHRDPFFNTHSRPVPQILRVIVNAAYVVDSVMAETEQGRAIKEIKSIDSGFDEFSFIAEMRDEFVPLLARAFFRIDNAVLSAHCTATAMAQMAAVAAAREAEGLEHDGTILSVARVELIKATQMEDARGGSTPLLLCSAQVQYIHAVRNKSVSSDFTLCARALLLAFEGGSVSNNFAEPFINLAKH